MFRPVGTPAEKGAGHRGVRVTTTQTSPPESSREERAERPREDSRRGFGSYRVCRVGVGLKS